MDIEYEFVEGLDFEFLSWGIGVFFMCRDLSEVFGMCKIKLLDGFICMNKW